VGRKGHYLTDFWTQCPEVADAFAEFEDVDNEPAIEWWAALLSLAQSVIIFSITLWARFPGVRGWKTPVLKKLNRETA